MQETKEPPRWSVEELSVCGVVALLCGGSEAVVIRLMNGWLDPWLATLCLSVGYMFDLALLARNVEASPAPPVHASTARRIRAAVCNVRWGKVLADFSNTAYWVGLYCLGLGYFPRYGLPWLHGVFTLALVRVGQGSALQDMGGLPIRLRGWTADVAYAGTVCLLCLDHLVCYGRSWVPSYLAGWVERPARSGLARVLERLQPAAAQAVAIKRAPQGGA